MVVVGGPGPCYMHWYVLPCYTQPIHWVAHELTHLRRVEWFEGVRLRRCLRRLDSTKLAAPGASVPQEHDRSRSPIPALPDVGTLRLFAHGVQVQLLQRRLKLFVLPGREQEVNARQKQGQQRASGKP